MCIYVCVHACMFAYVHKYRYACMYYACMCAFTYAHLCIYLQILLFESYTISIYKKIVFSVFLTENYLDEVAIWGSTTDEVDSSRGYFSLHILNVGLLSDAWVTDIFPSVCLSRNFLESLFGGSGRGVQLLLCPGLKASPPLLGGRSSSLTGWPADQQSGQLQEGSTWGSEEGRDTYLASQSDKSTLDISGVTDTIARSPSHPLNSLVFQQTKQKQTKKTLNFN